MKITALHIENFGKFSNFNCEFESGLNVFLRDNGWGKSTLAAFVKVMFYGFDNEGKRDELINERRKYAPWQGGVYGGSLSFFAGGKKYRIVRTFKNKISEDTFALYDESTNLLSNDFSDNIGEELFQIDSASFMRTIMISQNDCETQSTDGINAKIGNLTEVTDDINNYEQVMNSLKNSINALTPDRKTGEINRLKSEITEQEYKLRSAPGLDEAIQSNKTRQKEEIANREEYKKKIEELRHIQSLMDKNKLLMAKQASYKRICDNYAAKEKKYREIRGYFKKDVPDLESVHKYLDRSQKMARAVQTRNLYKPSEEEIREYDFLQKMFAQHPYDEDKNAEILEKLHELSDARQQAKSSELTEDDAFEFEMLKNKFEGKDIGEDIFDNYVEAWNERNEKKAVIESKAETVAGMRRAFEQKKNDRTNLYIGLICLIFGAVFAAAVYLNMLTFGDLRGVALGVSAAVCVVGIVFVILFLAGGKKRNTPPAPLREIEEEIAKDNEYIEQVDKSTAEFLGVFSQQTDENGILNAINDLKNDYRNYLKLKEK
ncbi:MAG: AAA family ATPase, partial [Lachnospiraceae bacterium]|nr:AAA family ATPase [Lachnospiraceae bacterium]